MARVFFQKGYRILLVVYPSKERHEALRGDFGELTKFLRDAPEGSPLRFAVPDDGHTPGFPRYRMRYRGSARTMPGYELEFCVRQDVDTDAFVGELRALFEKNGWLDHG